MIKNKYLKIDDKKHYTLAHENQKVVSHIQKINFNYLADFTSNVFNLMLIEEAATKKGFEKLPSRIQKYFN